MSSYQAGKVPPSARSASCEQRLPVLGARCAAAAPTARRPRRTRGPRSAMPRGAAGAGGNGRPAARGVQHLEQVAPAPPGDAVGARAARRRSAAAARAGQRARHVVLAVRGHQREQQRAVARRQALDQAAPRRSRRTPRAGCGRSPRPPGRAATTEMACWLSVRKNSASEGSASRRACAGTRRTPPCARPARRPTENASDSRSPKSEDRLGQQLELARPSASCAEQLHDHARRPSPARPGRSARSTAAAARRRTPVSACAAGLAVRRGPRPRRSRRPRRLRLAAWPSVPAASCGGHRLLLERLAPEAAQRPR